METPAGSASDAGNAAPGERTLSWLDEDAPEPMSKPMLLTPAEPPDPPPPQVRRREPPTRRIGLAFRRAGWPRWAPRQRQSPENDPQATTPTEPRAASPTQPYAASPTEPRAASSNEPRLAGTREPADYTPAGRGPANYTPAGRGSAGAGPGALGPVAPEAAASGPATPGSVAPGPAGARLSRSAEKPARLVEPRPADEGWPVQSAPARTPDDVRSLYARPAGPAPEAPGAAAPYARLADPPPYAPPSGAAQARPQAEASAERASPYARLADLPPYAPPGETAQPEPEAPAERASPYAQLADLPPYTPPGETAEPEPESETPAAAASPYARLADLPPYAPPAAARSPYRPAAAAPAPYPQADAPAPYSDPPEPAEERSPFARGAEAPDREAYPASREAYAVDGSSVYPQAVEFPPDPPLVEPPPKRRWRKARQTVPRQPDPRQTDRRQTGQRQTVPRGNLLARPRRPGARKKRLLLIGGLLAIVALLAAAAVVAYPRVVRPAGPPLADPGDVVSAPIGNRTDAEFDLISGASSVTVTSADLGGDLYRISTPEGASGAPRPVHKGKAVELQLAASGLNGPSAVTVRLSSRLPWRVRLTGGADAHKLDLRAGTLRGLDVVGGASRVDLSLPKPQGTVPLKLTGGIGQLLVHAPRDVPARVRVGSGATNVRLDDFSRNSPSPGTVFTPDDWEDGRDRYDLDAVAGVGTLRLDRVQ
ncbi:hypothetical protein WEI85_18315 [Actinomycetes bacterium KLBMP 9797]